MTHVTRNEIEQFASGQVSPQERQRVLLHVDECAECRVTAAEASHASAKALSFIGDWSRLEHPSADEIEQFVDDELDETSRESVDEHLDACSQCRREVETLRGMKRVSSHDHPRVARIGWAAAAVAAIALITSFLMMRGDQSPTAVVVTPPKPPVNVKPVPEPIEVPAVPLIASLNDGGKVIGVTAERRLHGITIGDRALEDAAVSFVIDGKLPQPKKLGTLGSADVVLLGEEQKATFALRSPLATFVAESRPRFQWTKAKAATSYVVSIFDEEFNEVASSGDLEVTEWTPANDLPRGKTLRWQVEAKSAAGEVMLAPRVEDGEAKFALLSAEDAKRAAELRRMHSDSKLLLAVGYARLGLREEAERLASEIKR